ncbi:hypothetical protein C0993_008115 [Termitomyces sp. T159_Od127]|nr:hypothetical protein C0993_008115 [Termitomyces sp. T159_Od127]
MSTTPNAPKDTTMSLEGCITNMVFEALCTKLAAQLQTGLGELRDKMEVLMAQITKFKGEDCRSGPRINISPPEKYNGAFKVLVEQFVHQIKVAAELEVFHNDWQKILWVQSYLMGSANAWSNVIMMGPDDSAFGLWDPAQDVLNHIGVLQQGSKSIMDEYIKDHFWKGLGVATMELLVNTNYEMAEQAWDILLRQESKLANIAAWRKGVWQAVHAAVPCALASLSLAVNTSAHIAPPPLADPNAMDMDQAKVMQATRKSFKCRKPEHVVVECPLWQAVIKAAVWEAIVGNKSKVEEAPKVGFV